jgi:hypothetical protein
MNFRRDGKTEHEDEREWELWKRVNADLIPLCGLPPGVLRSRRDWEYLLEYGYWCEDYYGKHIGNIDFDLDELAPEENWALRQLLQRTLTDEGQRRRCSAWHYVCPPSKTEQGE